MSLYSYFRISKPAARPVPVPAEEEDLFSYAANSDAEPAPEELN